MNKTEMSKRVSEKSGIDFEVCRKAVDALEKVMEEELADTKGLGGKIDKIYNVMHFFKGKKEENK